MALSRRERLVCLRALRLAEDYYKLIIRQPIYDQKRGGEISAVIRALKLVAQHDRQTLFAPPRRCPACEQLDRADGLGEGAGE